LPTLLHIAVAISNKIVVPVMAIVVSLVARVVVVALHANNGSVGHPGNPNNPYCDHRCDICGKLGHSTLRCWKRFDKNFTRPEKMANTTTTSYHLDPACYADSAATYHIMGDLDKLTMTESYGVQEQVHTSKQCKYDDKAHQSIHCFYPLSSHCSFTYSSSYS
jgi:hypothetical protein